MLRLNSKEYLIHFLKRYFIAIIITFVVIVAGIGTIIAYNSTSAEDLKLDFDRLWSEKTSDEDLTLKTIKRLESFLKWRPRMKAEDISNISEHLIVFITSGLKVIEYVENPEIYGDSNKKSYHIFISGSKVKLLLAGDSISMYRMVNSSDNEFIICAYDYHIEGRTGLRLFKIVTDDFDIHLLYNLIDKKAPADFEFIGESLYYKDSQVYVDKTSADGRLIGIVAVDNSGNERFFELKLLF